jgi:hypothetical protein
MTDILLRPTSATLRPTRPIALARLLFVAGLIAAYAATDAARECQGGAFSSAFGKGFDVRRCDLVISVGGLKLRAPLQQSLAE